jgi:hypothetical protein
LETWTLFAGSQGGTVAPAGGNTCAPRSARLDLRPPAVPRLIRSRPDHLSRRTDWHRCQGQGRRARRRFRALGRRPGVGPGLAMDTKIDTREERLVSSVNRGAADFRRQVRLDASHPLSKTPAISPIFKAGKVTLYVSARKEGGSVSVYSARRKALRRAKRRRRGADRLRHGRRTGLRAAGPAIGARGEHRARGAAARVGWSRPAADADERAWNPGLTCGGCRPCAPTPLDERGLIKRLLAYCPSLASAP